jgi:hypothetical protein
MKPVVKRKRPSNTGRPGLTCSYHQHWTVEDWKRVVWSDETKINRLGSDERRWVWKMQGEGLSDRLVEGTVKFGGGNLMMWGCMLWEGPGFACKMDGDLYIKIMQDELGNPWLITTNSSRMSSSSKTMTLNTPARRPKNGSKSKIFKSSHGLLSLQTLIQ